MVDIVLDRDPQVICQCLPPCHMPFKVEDGEWSPLGCTKPQGHEPPCSAEGPDDFTYRDPPQKIGPMLLMRRDPGEDLWRATCHRCGREYAVGAVTIGLDTIAAMVGVAAAKMTPEVPLKRPGICRRCGRHDWLIDGICGSCADDLREDAKAEEESAREEARR